MRVTGSVSCIRCDFPFLHKAEDREPPGKQIQMCFVLPSHLLVWRYSLWQSHQHNKKAAELRESHSRLLLFTRGRSDKRKSQSRADKAAGFFSCSLQVGWVCTTRLRSSCFAFLSGNISGNISLASCGVMCEWVRAHSCKQGWRALSHR